MAMTRARNQSHISDHQILRQASMASLADLLDVQRRRDNRRSCETQLETSLSDRDHPFHLGFGSTGTPAFGSSNTATGTSGGGLFGSNTASSFGTGAGAGASGGFGANNNQSGSLFGQAQNRPASFGGANTTGSAGGFGTNTATGGFGSAGNASSAFGGGGSGFGSNNNNTPNANSSGGSLFGKPASTGFGTGGFASAPFGGSTNATAISTGFGGGSVGNAGAESMPPHCDGTGGTPFSAFVEKDTNTNATNHYQSVSFMQPYSKFSFEELRLADYQQGRRFGNASGQAGAFGNSAFGTPAAGGFGTQQNTGFGGSTTPFGGGGATTSAPSAFGQTPTAGGFGSNNANPLFGGAKPTGSLFGNTGTTTGAQPSAFGTAPGTGFGNSTGTGGFGSSPSLFGGQNQQQNKPAGFGTSTTPSTGGFGGGGFGTTQPTTSANPFGGTTATASPFGAQPATGTNTLGGFGAQNQTQNKSLFGNTGSTFGANNTQQQSGTGGLFGNNAAGGNTGGLFGQPNQQQQPQQQPQQAGTGLFNQSAGAGGGLFGTAQNAPQQKPAGGLFGTSTGTTGGAFGGGGFGASQPQPSGGLLNNPQNQPAKPSLFGTPGGTGLFGGGQNTGAQNTGGGLFGTQSQQQQQPAGNSLFGSPQPMQPQQPQQPAPGSFTSSLLEGNPYGSQSIFSGLPTPSAPSPGPVARPLSSTQEQRARGVTYNLNPSASLRNFKTMPRSQGYRFPSSPSSASSTPGLRSSMSVSGSGLTSGSLHGSFNGSFSGSFNRNSLVHSASTNNMRGLVSRQPNSVLERDAMQSSGGHRGSSLRNRLVVNHELRNSFQKDLFSPQPSSSPATITNGEDVSLPADKLKKKVSFDSPGTGGELVVTEKPDLGPTPEELGFLRSTRKSGSLNGIDPIERPEMESVTRDLPVVPENSEPVPVAVKHLTVPTGDPKPGEYWMKPSASQLQKMSRDQLKRVVDFTVGRHNCGQVTFNGAVDLTTVDMEKIFGDIVDIGLRKITVYPEESNKPAMGKGLNVPSTLRIENSWPRSRDKKRPAPIINGPFFDKHIDRLQKVTDTEFIDYELETGTWVFTVPHFTTYGLDYDEDEEGESLDQSTMSAGPDNRTPKADHPISFEQSATFSIDESFVGSMAGMDDDTFDFKKHKLVPGSFGNQAMAMEDREMDSEGEDESFLEEGSAGSTTEHDDDVTESQLSGDSIVGSDEEGDMDMAGSFPSLHRTVEQDDDQSSVLETTQPIFKPFGTPPKPRLNLSGDWTEQLQRTISPRKQNRDALREIQANAFTDRHLFNEESSTESTASPKKGFTNSIDLMNSLFQQQPKKQNAAPQLKASASQPKGFEWPYNKQPKTFADNTSQMDETDSAFHESFKPRWGPMDSIICAKNDLNEPLSEINHQWRERYSVFSEARDVTVLGYSQPVESTDILDVQKQQSTIQRVDGIPLVRLAKIDLRQFAFQPAREEERLIWQLANILFNDDIEDDISAGVPPQLRMKYSHRIKKDRLTRLWKGVIRDRHAHDLDHIRSPEERAVHLLCSNRVEEACKTLIDGQNYHLATLVAQIGRDATSRADMADQIEVWRQNNVLSEMTEPVRALYELVSGNSLRSEGKSGGALEDRASSFVFTERFELDWLQAFGLRLWYGITEDEPIEAAVSKFLDDLTTGLEPAFPHPAQSANSQTSVQPGSDTLGRESPLWVLLKAYSAASGNTKVPATELPAALLPQSVSGNLLANRLSFQLYHVLTTVMGENNAVKINQVQADHLVWDYASELISGGQLSPALFVLLHLSRPDDRKRAVQETLARFGANLPNPTSLDSLATDPVWLHFTVDLQIPDAWIWVAKALDARDRGDAIREVDCLIHGKHWNDAHATFCRVVGPTTIISRDYQTLEKLVNGFGDGPERKMRGWASGGGIYEDFLRLVTAPAADGDRVRDGSGMNGLEERVAFKEMSRAVAGWITHEDVRSVESSAVLGLPLTGDARVLQTVEMSRRYYGVVMAGGF
ncbi:hypothetical protein N7454_008801 [Penicillium verhagenii]|nr:hypothetical protein N7454_008801 [Penicillium verhagenii]